MPSMGVLEVVGADSHPAPAAPGSRASRSLALVFGFASGVSAQDKSWEVDVYGDEAEVTYVPDGRDDIHVYDHNNHYNDRSYIEVEPPRYGYRGGYDHGGARYDNRRYDYYGGRHGYPRHNDRPTRYRVEYHNRFRGW